MTANIDILMKKLAKVQFKFALQIASLVGTGVVLVSLLMGMAEISRLRRSISYYAAFENGDTVKVDNIIAVPILSVEQIGRMWPEYYVETMVKVGGKEMTLRSKPFLFCDNPELEGSYAGRDVYCPLKGE